MIDIFRDFDKFSQNMNILNTYQKILNTISGNYNSKE